MYCLVKKEGNVKHAEAGHPQAPKHKTAGKRTRLSEQSFCWNSGKGRVYESWEKGQATQEDKHVMRLWREKIRRAKS